MKILYPSAKGLCQKSDLRKIRQGVWIFYSEFKIIGQRDTLLQSESLNFKISRIIMVVVSHNFEKIQK